MLTEKQLQTIELLTHKNCHNSAVLYLAQEVQDDETIVIMMSIKNISRVMGRMTADLIKFREDIVKGLLGKIKADMPENQYEKIKTLLT